MNIDTGLHSGSWQGVANYFCSNSDYLQNQIGNPNCEIYLTKILQ
jgi:hypothetical protein